MAVVTTKSDLIHDPLNRADGAPYAPDPHKARGRPVYATGTVANASDDSSGSTYLLADIPSTALLHEDTFFDVEAWGFAQVVIGVTGDTDALVDQTKATENIVTPIAAGDANHGKALWEVLGMAADPGGNIRLIASAEAGATGAGSMPFRIAYLAP